LSALLDQPLDIVGVVAPEALAEQDGGQVLQVAQRAHRDAQALGSLDGQE
jgi:hypothetical protein